MITLNTTIPENVAASARLNIQATTDLTPLNRTILTVEDASGFAKLSFSTATGIEVGMVLTITGATADYAYLNGRHNVTAFASGKATISAPYAAATTGTKGTAVDTFDKFSAKISFSSDAGVGSAFYVPFVGSVAIKDLSRSISGYFTSNFSLTEKWNKETTMSCIMVTLGIEQSALNKDYERVTIGTGVTDSFMAVRSTDLAGRILENGTTYKTLLSKNLIKAHVGTKVIIPIYTLEEDVKMYWQWTNGTLITDGLEVLDTKTYKAFYVFTIPAGCKSATFYVIYQDEEVISETVTVQVMQTSACDVYPLYWLNRYGGYEMYEFIKTTSKLTGNKVEMQRGSRTTDNVAADFSTERWNELTLVGSNEPGLEYLQDLLVSSEVYNADGERVKVLTKELDFSSLDVVTPEIVVMVDKNRTIW